MADTTVKSSENKYYDLELPVFKKGDDLSHSIEEAEGNIQKGFLAQASFYEQAASICRRLAGVAAEIPGLAVTADTHMIEVYGPADRLSSLVEEGILYEHEDYDDEDETFFYDDDVHNDIQDLADAPALTPAEKE